jgi:hypothetical protein
MPSNVPMVAEAARAIRMIPAFKAVKILVGGPAFSDREARETIMAGPERVGIFDCLASSFSEALEFASSVGHQNRQA